MKAVTGFITGLVFSLGLTLSGMTDPARVVGFLDVAGDWDPTLIFVLGGAVITTFLGYRLAWRRSTSLLGERFQLPTRRDIDGRLLLGAALFGTGWGLSGYCPGPAIVSSSAMSLPLAGFLLTMLLGWWLATRLTRAH
ncbi:DUF6691 family protein [Cobetia marina]|uniref:DUF6691 family protein n=1 Tax=Cobetia marina TaxID=28258 RepID=UPI00385796E8